jgi:peptidylamidoglycolate lyase
MPINRRTFLRVAAITFGSMTSLPSQAMNAPEGKESHALDTNWPALDPKSYPERCQVSGVAIGKDGNLLILNRGENPWMPNTGYKQQPIKKPTVLVVDPATGGLVGSWGTGLFVMPHQISVDAAGNVWIVDCGSNKIVQFDAAGKKLLEIGGPGIGFRMPTDIAFLSDGTFVVSDGYTNSRVVKFNAKGKITAAWGTKGKESLQFQTPHSVAVDDNDLIYVADRENHRIQVLNAQGKVQAIWKNVERPLTVRFQAEHLFVLSNLDAEQGIVRKLNKQGEVISAFHTKPRDTKEDFEWPHGLAVNADGTQVYVGFTLTGRRVQRYKQVMT